MLTVGPAVQPIQPVGPPTAAQTGLMAGPVMKTLLSSIEKWDFS